MTFMYIWYIINARVITNFKYNPYLLNFQEYFIDFVGDMVFFSDKG
jgi:hypothetical protein